MRHDRRLRQNLRLPSQRRRSLRNSAYGLSSHMTTKTTSPFGSTKSLTILSHLLLGNDASFSPLVEPDLAITKISEEEFTDLLALANSNHVLMRGLKVFLQ